MYRQTGIRLSPIVRLHQRRAYAKSVGDSTIGKAVDRLVDVVSTKKAPRAEGTIASVFASLSGEKAVALPARFADLKREIAGSESVRSALSASWEDLVRELERTTQEISSKGSDIVPDFSYADIKGGLDQSSIQDIKKRGCLVVRNVVPEAKALEWLESIKSYIRTNPQVKGFPEDDKAVYELYWSKAQLEARSHPAQLDVQRFLLSLWNKKSTGSSIISFNQPLSYADRLRIRRPGDSRFALGPHCDGGSVERWEDALYRQSYKAILEGRWRGHDPWDVASRPDANTNLYDGPGACGVFRALQGWTSLSHTGPNEGTLKVFPAIKESSAYMMLRPFFRPTQPRIAVSRKEYLAADNWVLDLDSTEFPGSPLGRSQEFSDETHPHLELDKTMISMKKVAPGDCVFWYADGIHSVEASNQGQNAASVLYIPSVPTTLANVRYIKDQREQFLAGTPPPDFPGGVGESAFEGKGSTADILTEEGRRAMGLAQFDTSVAADEGERDILKRANAMLQ